MKKLVAGLIGSILVAGAVVSAPALGQSAKVTEMVDLGGKGVDSLLLRYGFDAMWAVDDQHILLRDGYRDHYVLTLKAPCHKLDMDRGVNFVPLLAGRVYSSHRYEARDVAGPPCDIVKIEKIQQDAANAMKASLAKG